MKTLVLFAVMMALQVLALCGVMRWEGIGCTTVEDVAAVVEQHRAEPQSLDDLIAGMGR